MAPQTKGRGGRRYLPYAFTEHGVAMLSSVLRSQQAVAANIAIMRSHDELARRLDELERAMKMRLGRHDEQLAAIVETLRRLTQPAPTPRRRVGFTADEA